MNRISESSISVYLFSRLSLCFFSYVNICREIYTYSLLHKIKTTICSRLWVYLKNSFLGKISEPGKISFAALESSRVILFIAYLYRVFRNKVFNLYKISGAKNLLKELKDEFYSSGIRNLSIIAVCVILANIFSLWLLKRQIGLMGLIVRIMFLLIALGGLFSKSKFYDVSRSSLIAKYLKNLSL